MATRYLLSLILLCLSTGSAAREPTEEELERWLEDDEQELPYPDYSSGAELNFIAPITDRRIPHSHTRLSISLDSLAEGWVAMRQCHEGLDPVPDAQVVYRFRAMRELQVLESQHISSAMVEGQSVQLKDVGHQARLYVSAMVQILNPVPEGGFHLRYGPFKRKFLDSYFPMHVSLEITYPQELLDLSKFTPQADGAYQLTREAGRLVADTWFSGELTFEMDFTSR